jgi:hypothetical protein
MVKLVLFFSALPLQGKTCRTDIWKLDVKVIFF